MRLLYLLVLALAACAIATAAAPAWVGYRGPEGTGVFAESKPPVDCDMQTGRNILWRTPLPNWGHGDVAVNNNRAFVISEAGWKSDWPVLSCIDITTGKVLWEREVNHLPVTGLSQAKQDEVAKKWHDFHAEWRKLYTTFAETVGQGDQAAAKVRLKEMGYNFGGHHGGGYGQLRSLDPKPKFYNREAGLRDDVWRHACGLGYDEIGSAFATPVTDDTHVYVVANRSAVACYDLEGNLSWMKFMPFPKELRGYNESNGRSPILYGDMLITDYPGYTVAFDKKTGEKRWQVNTYGGGIATPVVITVAGTDILITEGNQGSSGGIHAIRLPDGKELKLDGWGPGGNSILLNTDHRDVAYFSGPCHTGFNGAPASDAGPKAWTSLPAGVRFALDGETLKATVLWEGKRIQKTSGTGVELVYNAGRLYIGNAIVDAISGELFKGAGSVPPTRQMLLLASDRVYGLDGRIGLSDAPPAVGATVTLSCYSIDGHLLGNSPCINAPVVGEKLAQIRSQVGWDRWAFDYALPFMISGDRLYLRSTDELICVGYTVRGLPGDDTKVVEAIRTETDVTKLSPYVTDASAQYRYEAIRRLGALKATLTDELRESLRNAVVKDLYEEVRSAALLTLDACDAKGRAGWTAFAAEITAANSQTVGYGKPGYAEYQERLRCIRTTLRPLGDGGKAYIEKRWPDANKPILRYALLEMVTINAWKVDALVTDVLAVLQDKTRGRNDPIYRLLIPYLAAIDAAGDPKLIDAIAGISDWRLYLTCHDHMSKAQLLTWLEAFATASKDVDSQQKVLQAWRYLGAEAIPSMERVAAKMAADDKNTVLTAYATEINKLIAEIKKRDVVQNH
ncbi:MAG: PQQ-binding-like beta-propeller repeat protein [bacterium]